MTITQLKNTCFLSLTQLKNVLMSQYSRCFFIFILYLFDAYEMYNFEHIGDMEKGQISTFYTGRGAVLNPQWLCYAESTV